MTDMFFFQAEDGIRDIGVTGVQTCALPISRRGGVRLQSREQTLRRCETMHLALAESRQKLQQLERRRRGGGRSGARGTEARPLGEEGSSRGLPAPYQNTVAVSGNQDGTSYD